MQPLRTNQTTRDKIASEKLSDGAVTPNYRADREAVIEQLNSALATELVCVLRYKRHAEMARGIHSEALVKEFREHAVEEQGHADALAKRISQLNGEPNYNPVGLEARSHTRYVECHTLREMLEANLIAERVAIDKYSELIRTIQNNDPTTRRLIESILENEEEHADDLARLLERFPTDV